MTNQPFISQSFHVGPRTVTMTLDERPNKRGEFVDDRAIQIAQFGQYRPTNVTCLQCEWFPNPPSRLSRHERRQYLKGRGKFMSTLAKKLEGGVAVLDV